MSENQVDTFNAAYNDLIAGHIGEADFHRILIDRLGYDKDEIRLVMKRIRCARGVYHPTHHPGGGKLQRALP